MIVPFYDRCKISRYYRELACWTQTRDTSGKRVGDGWGAFKRRGGHNSSVICASLDSGVEQSTRRHRKPRSRLPLDERRLPVWGDAWSRVPTEIRRSQPGHPPPPPSPMHLTLSKNNNIVPQPITTGSPSTLQHLGVDLTMTTIFDFVRFAPTKIHTLPPATTTPPGAGNNPAHRSFLPSCNKGAGSTDHDHGMRYPPPRPPVPP